MHLEKRSTDTIVFLLEKAALSELHGFSVPDFLKNQLLSWVELLDKNEETEADILRLFLNKEKLRTSHELDKALLQFLGLDLHQKLKDMIDY
ncbi:hypothetical protein JCM9157_4032 [Halalkalibacter akibai JCM 9157]|uniref:Uncharacterized protein n=1 Tax=Halalkalibacter akibai (strain ATCC 43226 / DSM 21942 / CIP 109018 / JCM 9157 / 1139) TaxID=1236973 RepID=W4QY15_HALA3|nr:hypothetical protein JCM9157_4032 [Halalkalibacter akibai JCM 9157]